jgi:hypothetical protein
MEYERGVSIRFTLALEFNWSSSWLAVTSFLEISYGGEASVLDLSDGPRVKVIPISAGIVGNIETSLVRSLATYQQSIHNPETLILWGQIAPQAASRPATVWPLVSTGH